MNDDLITQVASRTDPPPPPVADLNAPIDQTQADCLTAQTLIRGWIAAAKEQVTHWEPFPMPAGWNGVE
jgi:hypothetical protein